MRESCNKQSREKQELPRILVATSWSARLHKLCTASMFWLCGILNCLFFFFFLLFIDN